MSGITANPAIGYLSDWLVKQGGRTILTETTEFTGTQSSLGQQGATPEISQQICDLIDSGERHVVEVLGENAAYIISPGNMEGGMSTIQEKSLGCIRKAGYSPVTQVVDHGEIPTKQGLIIMDGPGYDTESMTGLLCRRCSDHDFQHRSRKPDWASLYAGGEDRQQQPCLSCDAR